MAGFNFNSHPGKRRMPIHSLTQQQDQGGEWSAAQLYCAEVRLRRQCHRRAPGCGGSTFVSQLSTPEPNADDFTNIGAWICFASIFFAPRDAGRPPMILAKARESAYLPRIEFRPNDLASPR
jgi:hypothetical protein